MFKSHLTPDGDHEITLRADGVWYVTMVDDDDDCVLYKSTDYERCAETVAEVVADYAEYGDSTWD